VSAERVFVRRASYHDSVALMLASNEAEKRDRVTDATAAMATPLNLELLARQGFHLDADALTPNDLVVAVRAEDDAALEDAIAAIEARLAARPAGTSAEAETPLRSMRAAARARPELNLAFLSVPGRNVTYEIAEALDAGLNVFCFSEGTDPAAEARLKQRALAQGLLLMGPDCGTAILDGVAFGFANAVRPGPVGIVGASGTGIQEVCCLLDAVGIGVSQAIGVGGRDLTAEVGGLMTVRALELLSDDPGTEVIVVISKPPDGEVAASVARAAAASGKPTVLAFPGGPPAPLESVAVVSSLEEGARSALALLGSELPVDEAPSPAVTPGLIRGLFSGGTLCYEAMAIVSGAVGEVLSNIPLRPEWRLEDVYESRGHTFVDFGDQALTEGRLHPMIDYRLRLDRLRAEAADPEVGVILLDVVLGFGAHPDPAGELAPEIERARAERGTTLSVFVAVCGAEGDPQGLDDQLGRLRSAGALVTRGTAAAARAALGAAGV
jgi:FdrA protein